MEEAKPISKSKTFWFNFIGALLTVLEVFTNVLKDNISDNAHLIMLAIAVGGNAALRYYTSVPIRITDK